MDKVKLHCNTYIHTYMYTSLHYASMYVCLYMHARTAESLNKGQCRAASFVLCKKVILFGRFNMY